MFLYCKKINFSEKLFFIFSVVVYLEQTFPRRKRQGGRKCRRQQKGVKYRLQNTPRAILIFDSFKTNSPRKCRQVVEEEIPKLREKFPSMF